MPHVSVELHAEVPDQIEEIVNGTHDPFTGPNFHIPDYDSIPKESRIVYQRARKGKCMTCAQKCGPGTTIVVNGLGVIMIFCSPMCMSDMSIRGYLEEAYTDLTDRIKFRSEQHNEMRGGEEDSGESEDDDD